MIKKILLVSLFFLFPFAIHAKSGSEKEYEALWSEALKIWKQSILDYDQCRKAPTDFARIEMAIDSISTTFTLLESLATHQSSKGKNYLNEDNKRLKDWKSKYDQCKEWMKYVCYCLTDHWTLRIQDLLKRGRALGQVIDVAAFRKNSETIYSAILKFRWEYFLNAREGY